MMRGTMNVKSPNNTSKWWMGFNSAFKGLIDNRLFSGSFLPSLLVTTNPRYAATISPSLVLSPIELVEITYLSAGHYKLLR
jgi:hypothetical protein